MKFMLDLVGYVESADLGPCTIVEPACGDGSFLIEIVSRLVRSARAFGRDPSELADAVRAYDLDGDSVATARARVESTLWELGLRSATSSELASTWIRQEDFLLADRSGLRAKWVVGNPPYIRVEEMGAAVYRRYRDSWSDMAGRADVYVGFFQASLALLDIDGVLAFICADRWMHNQYGAALRRRVIQDFALDVLLELHDVDVFESRVAAYPAITLMRNGPHVATALATATPHFDAQASSELIQWLSQHEDRPLTLESVSAAWLPQAFDADKSWPSGPPERVALIADLESRFPDLTSVGVTIGVGMATGADAVFVTAGEVDIEPDRLQPAVGPADLVDGRIEWIGRQIVSPWVGGELIDPIDFPRLRKYFDRHRVALKRRYVARRHKTTWWRTIDRPRPYEYARPKLIVADINDRIEPVLDLDGYWPLHSAYFIQSKYWDLEALGGYLMSDFAAAFVEAYSVKMANGHLRITSQYLRKIRIPQAADVHPDDRTELAQAFRNRDRIHATQVAQRILRQPKSST